MTSFIELDSDAVRAAACRCTPCTTASRLRATRSGAASAAAAPRRPLVRAAATTALVAVGGTVAGTGVGLATAATASATAAPDHPGWDGHRYWFRAHGEWRWTSHHAVYLRHAQPAARTGAGPLRQGWDGLRYWFQRRSDGAWRWTSHYDVYLRSTRAPAPLPTPTPPPVPAPPVVPAPPTAPSPGSFEAALAFASAQLGKPYVWGGNGPDGYDCSGLVQQAFLRAGVRLPRVSADQYWATRPIAAGDLRRGDLLFWSTSSRASGIHHVAIYLGCGRYIEAPRPGRNIRVSVLSTGYWPSFFGRVGR